MKSPIQIYISDSLTNLKPSSLIAYKQPTDSKFKLFATDKNGYIVEMESAVSSSITNVLNTDGYINVTGGYTKVINIDDSLFLEIQNVVNNSILLQKYSGENIPSYTPVAVYNNIAYKLDASNPLHKFAFAGFSTNGTTIGQVCRIKQIGEIELVGWNLTPNTHYLASNNGLMVTDNTSGTNFTKVIGYATTTDKLNIIKDYSSILKQ